MKLFELTILVLLLSRCSDSNRRLMYTCKSNCPSTGSTEQAKLNSQMIKDLIEKLDNCKSQPPNNLPPANPTYYVGPKPLSEIFEWIPNDGVYDIIMDYGKLVPGYFETRDGFVWLVFQKRTTGLLSFYRNWEDYKNGFGELEKEFWWGLQYLHDVLIEVPYILHVDLRDDESTVSWAEYTNFVIGNETDFYALNVGGFRGPAGDSLAFHNNKSFTTIDRDNDDWVLGNCAREHYGAWWYSNCQESNLNGLFISGGQISDRAINWYAWRSNYYSYIQCKMKIRPHVVEGLNGSG